MTTLKPCPFCGCCDGKIYTGPTGFPKIRCGECGATGPEKRTVSEALQAYANRAPDPCIDELEKRANQYYSALAVLEKIRGRKGGKAMEKFYTCDECAERLNYTDPEEAVYDEISGNESLFQDDEITLYEHTPMTIPDSRFEVLERLLESLDEDFGDPDGEYSKPTPGMIQAEKAFIEAMKQEYQVWSCEQTGKQTKTVYDWCMEFGFDDLLAEVKPAKGAGTNSRNR